MTNILGSLSNCFLLATVGSFASCAAYILLNFSCNCLPGFSSVLNLSARWHCVLLHCFKECQRGFCVILTGNCNDLISIVDVVSNEVILSNVSLDENFTVLSVTNKMNTFIVMTGPEEWNLAVGNKFAKHVKSSMSALIERSNPVLSSDSATSRPVWIARDITGSVYVLDVCLQERIAYNASVLG